jgi:hypothetical protein
MKPLFPMFHEKEIEQIIAIDIETSSKGELLDIGVYSEYGYHVHSEWKDFFDCLITFKGNIRVIAHNGFGFDFIGFNQWFLKNRKHYAIPDDDITYLSSESLIIAMIIKTEISQITFLDTMRYFPAQSLQKLAESFLGESKDDVSDDYISKMEIYKERFPSNYYAYLRKDCEILYRVYIEFRKEINDFTEIGEIGMSAGSTAMRSFRKWLSTDYPKTRIFSAPEEYQDLANYAFRGGLTLYIGDGNHHHHKYENVYHYDVISMYPSVMRYVPTPSSPLVYTDVVIKDFDCYRPGWYLCNYKQTRGRVPVLFPIGSEYPQWEGQAVLSYFELQFLDFCGEYEVLDGVCYEDYLFPFKSYFDDLLAIRMRAKRDKQSAKAHALKILANSLYGKFSQKAVREIISITSDKDFYETELEAQLRDADDTGITEYVVGEDYVIYGVESQSTAFSNRFIGAMVTSLARLKLGIVYNTIRTIYCDTDSIFSQDVLPEIFLGSLPGDFEQDEESPATMICLGKKSYQYGDDVKFKGVPAKNLTSDEINGMRFDISTEVKYKAPTAWKTAMKNHVERPNEFLPKKRRVSRGKSLAETGLLHTDGKLFTVDESREFLERLLSM